jgi:hypothetical protein
MLIKIYKIPQSSNLDDKFLAKHSIDSSAQSPDEFALDWQLQTLENFAVQLEWKWTTIKHIHGRIVRHLIRKFIIDVD